MQDFLKHFEKLSEQAQTLLDEMIDDLGPRIEELAPLIEGLAAKITDLNQYNPPEILPNGDIIIRRKPSPKTAPENTPVPMAPPSGAIDL